MLTSVHIIFYLFAAAAVCSAMAVVTMRNPVHSVLALVVTFFAMSGVWMLLQAEFLSLILLLVYVGAVMTLFLFVVMMLNINKENKQAGFVRYWPLGVIFVLLIIGLIFAALGPHYFGLATIPAPAPLPAGYSNIQQLGEILYTHFAYPFEIAGALLLAAIIAAITLAYHGPKKRKIQHPNEQVAVRPEDRVRLIKMQSEKKQGDTGCHP